MRSRGHTARCCSPTTARTCTSWIRARAIWDALGTAVRRRRGELLPRTEPRQARHLHRPQAARGYEALRARNPRLVYCSISGYGQSGPSRDEAAMDLVVQASSGLLSVTGTTDGESVRCGYGVTDVTAGLFAVIGILLALRARETTGIGQYIDVSMLDCMISTMTSNYLSYLGSGVVPRPMGTEFPTIVPYRVYRTADGASASPLAARNCGRRSAGRSGVPIWSAIPATKPIPRASATAARWSRSSKASSASARRRTGRRAYSKPAFRRRRCVISRMS
jgi:hypothetical protein